MKQLTILAILLVSALPVSAQKAKGAMPKMNYSALNKQAAKEYLVPIRRGNAERPYWNIHAKKFIYAPAFGFKKVAGAKQYMYKLRQGKRSWQFKASSPDADLSKVWNDITPGQTELEVIALSDKGESLGTAGKASFMRDFPFAGPYPAAPHGYRDAAIKGLLYVHNLDAIKYWKNHDEPDMSHENNTYACKIIGATVRAECLLSQLVPSIKDEALLIARNAAECLMRISQPAGAPLAYFPPTYYLEPKNKGGWPHHTREVNKGKTMFLEATQCANAFLDLYEITKEKKYYEQAMHITETYLKHQNPDGSFPIKVYIGTGKAVENVWCTPAPILVLAKRFKDHYGVSKFDGMVKKAERWMNNNYLKTFNLTGQFEDQPMEGVPPYDNLTNCTANEYAFYLLSKPAPAKEEIKVAEDLTRFCEDQFTHWDIFPNALGLRPEYTPNVHEQYHYETPVDASASDVARAFFALYKTTGDKLWLAKALALTDAVACMQNGWNGQIPTTWEFASQPFYVERTFWINCTLASAIQLLRISEFSGESKFDKDFFSIWGSL